MVNVLLVGLLQPQTRLAQGFVYAKLILFAKKSEDGLSKLI